MKLPFQFGKITGISIFCGALLMAATGLLSAQAPTAPAAATATSTAPAPAKSTLTVRLTGFRNAKGKIKIALYRDGKGFPSDPSSAVASQSFEIDPQTLTATAVFTNLPQGTYAVSSFHDENMTGKMEFSDQGVPLNGYGISNNPEGPPTAEQAGFKVNQAECTIEIKMVYWQ